MRYNGTERDAEIKSALEAALTRIEDVQNISLRPMTVQLTIKWPENYNALYLHPVDSVVSVKDQISGNPIEYSPCADNSAIKVQTRRNVIVEYKTIEAPQMQSLKEAICTMATMIFDGVTDMTAYRKLFGMLMTPNL